MPCPPDEYAGFWDVKKDISNSDISFKLKHKAKILITQTSGQETFAYAIR